MVGASSSDVKISNLDLGNPLHLQTSDFNSNTIISVKLTGTENYRVWDVAMKLAINTRNKTGFPDGTCLKSTYANSDPLSNQWETCNSIVGIASSSSGSVTKPHVSSFVAKSNSWNNNGNKKLIITKRIGNSTNNRGPNPSMRCANCGKVGHTVDRCFDIIGYPPGYNKNPGSKPSGPKTLNANSVSSSSKKGASLSFTNEQMMKLMNLINEAPSGSVQANMAGHPNGTPAKIKYVEILKLSDKIVLFDVLVIPEYCDLHQNKIVRTGSENGGLYMFDYDSPLSSNSQTIEPFPFTTDIGELIHLDLWGPYKVQNGIAERKHRHLLNVARSLLFQSGIPLNMWTECVLTAAYLINRLSSSVLNGKSPFELVYGFKPKLSHLRSFGCLCFSSVLNNSDKFSAKSEKCVLIGFSTTKRLINLQKEQSILSASSNNNVNGINFFDETHSDFQTSLSPNDDGRVYDTPHNDGNDHPCSNNADDCEDDFATSMGVISRILRPILNLESVPISIFE
ncbi:ribonuclease H-like domain-containing protein [Tanacetum coccineum]